MQMISTDFRNRPNQSSLERLFRKLFGHDCVDRMCFKTEIRKSKPDVAKEDEAEFLLWAGKLNLIGGTLTLMLIAVLANMHIQASFLSFLAADILITTGIAATFPFRGPVAKELERVMIWRQRNGARESCVTEND